MALLTGLSRGALRLLEHAWLVIVLFALWWFASAGSASIYFPPLSEILGTLWNGLTEGPLVPYMWFSLRNLALGLLLAGAAGVLAGLFVGEYEGLRRVVDPILQFARAIPQSALIPIVIGILGIGAAPKVYVIAFACVWPILLNTIDGVRGMDPNVDEMARAYRIPAFLRMRRVVLPAALPQIVAGMRVALSIGVIIMVVSELFGAKAGVGFYILRAGSNFSVAETWAGTLLVGALGYLLSTAFVVFERLVLGWYFESARSGGGSAPRTVPRLRKARQTQ